MQKTLILMTAFSLLMAACGSSDKAVKAKRPTPPHIEFQALEKINKVGSDLTTFGTDITAFGQTLTNTQSYLTNPTIVQKTNQEIKGMRVSLISTGNNTVKFLVNMIEHYQSGCHDRKYESNAVNRNNMEAWVPLSGGLKASCLNNCEYVVVVIDRVSPDSSRVGAFGPTVPQAGAVILERDGAMEGEHYRPTKSTNAVFLNDTIPPEYGMQKCLAEPAPVVQNNNVEINPDGTYTIPNPIGGTNQNSFTTGFGLYP